MVVSVQEQTSSRHIISFYCLMQPKLLFVCRLQLTARRRVIQRPKPWRLPRLWNPALLSRRRPRRSGHQLHFIGQGHWRRKGTPSIPALVHHQETSWTIIKFSSIHWLLSLQWRRLRTTTHLFSLLTSELIRRRLKMQLRRCTTFRPRKWTPWSGICY